MKKPPYTAYTRAKLASGGCNVGISPYAISTTKPGTRVGGNSGRQGSSNETKWAAVAQKYQANLAASCKQEQGKPRPKAS